jgi:hypothetical protein
MRKFYLAFFILPACYISFGQSSAFKITKEYFRSDPFQKEFSSFLQHLFNDPSLTNKVLEKRTDTSLFYFQGTYTNHNPFFFKPKRIEVVLAQSVVEQDSLIIDTIYTYQLLAYNNDTKEEAQELKKEFEKIHRRYKNSFFKTTFSENPAGNKLKEASYNFFDPFNAVAPFSVSWFGPDENQEICLVLTIRMQAKNNKAILPIPLYAP